MSNKLKVLRFTSTSELVYQDVEVIFDVDNQKKVGVKNFLTVDYLDQIVVKTNDEFIIMTDWSLGLLEVKKMKIYQDFKKIKRITVNGIQFSPAYLIDEKLWNKYNIPIVCSSQMVFVADGSLYITRQVNLTEMVI